MGLYNLRALTVPVTASHILYIKDICSSTCRMSERSPSLTKTSLCGVCLYMNHGE